MTESTLSDPVVRTGQVREVARDVLVIPDGGVRLVPNIGIIGGTHSVLVVETGLGPDNAEAVLAFAAEHARGRRLFLTTTHFHPEHAFGAQVFAGEATYLLNRAQAEDLAGKGPGYLSMFRGLGEPIARRLAGVEPVVPDTVYDDAFDLDLGGRVVRLRATGRAHSRGDQVVSVPDAGVMFTGDLVEAGQFAIFPWFPPYDTDVSGIRWIEVLKRLSAQHPRVVVPGHGGIGGTGLLADVRTYLELLRDETWRRRDSAMSEATIAEEVRQMMVERHPEWVGEEWIERGVGCLCAEHEVSG
ncbi:MULTISPECIES: MBL fold metallo-hydrolase [Streptomyces]|uniref:MBL fold metallo-hydrolase n=1 Tax=Streptomyces caniscabiei TaxID=2746961 RepID=A0ABU4MXV8_9ACTN|nr:MULTISPECIES: MBL fold metallo-hydrolase [Streptomyces]MBE4734034.1 MBL fold metallo-hydrolase [Streptomyces caniscabiei]MBE4762386.1 MBL fold metallo-hydrolase [Streptomyces caniscabiei]MBE4769109.1 MBL fold metallo-hydrolase [Streptomyces caniscabiei]MBE4782757.1 MBL fold metallo-hydrolase [Streptomyces caniscabiei]MBE4792060.1 MBL fold metallo-hydrolase [Streptomyces caniscabiei]